MLEQLAVIVWAQFRITRNHFPRTSFGSVLSWSVTLLWYMAFTIVALSAARAIEHADYAYLPLSLSIGLLGIFAYMQIVPLVTLSGGWSLQLDRLKAFPIQANTLFLIELVLRLTSAPEMLILLGGVWLGLMLRPDVGAGSPFLLLLLLPLSLLLQLAARVFVLHSFSRSRLREILTILFLGIALAPQLLVRDGAIDYLKPYLLKMATGSATPWRQIALLSLGQLSWRSLAYCSASILAWTAGAGLLARWQFLKSLRSEELVRVAPDLLGSARPRAWALVLTARLPDPMAALLEKELRTLLRMPRFRILLGMACLFSCLIFLPLALQAGRESFFGRNAGPLTGLYGLMLLSDALLLNIFGFDRAAAQLYFAGPASLTRIIQAKNLAAVLLIGLQSLAAPLLFTLFRMPVDGLSLAAGLLASALVTVFLLSAGNLLSVYLPRPVDPRSALRKQGGAKVQIWILGCTIGVFVFVGFAFLARWATARDWMLLAVLGFELLVGLIVYPIALESAVARARNEREQITAALAVHGAPFGMD